MSEIINFASVKRCRRHYRNNHGHRRAEPPTVETCCGSPIDPEFLEAHKARGWVDNWKLVVRLEYSRHDADEFYGAEGQKYWDAYAAFVFSKTKRKNGKSK